MVILVDKTGSVGRKEFDKGTMVSFVEEEVVHGGMEVSLMVMGVVGREMVVKYSRSKELLVEERVVDKGLVVNLVKISGEIVDVGLVVILLEEGFFDQEIMVRLVEKEVVERVWCRRELLIEVFLVIMEVFLGGE